MLDHELAVPAWKPPVALFPSTAPCSIFNACSEMPIENFLIDHTRSLIVDAGLDGGRTSYTTGLWP